MVADGRADGFTLEALLLLVGALPPAAVCRIGAHVARALSQLPTCHGALTASVIQIDEAGGATLVPGGTRIPEGRLLSPERRVNQLPSTADDLWALGIVLADATFGVPCAPGPDGTLGIPAKVPERLADALRVLVAPSAEDPHGGRWVSQARGDGRAHLTRAIADARRSADVHGPMTIPDATIADFTPALVVEQVPFVPSPQVLQPVTVQLGRDEPRTMEMRDSGVVGVTELRRLSELAQEAARRKDALKDALAVPPPALAAPPAEPVLDRTVTDELPSSWARRNVGPLVAVALVVVALLVVAFVAGHYAK